MSVGSLIAIIFLLLVVAGAYFAYKEGYLSDITALISSQPVEGLATSPQPSEVSEQGEVEVSNSSISFMSNSNLVEYLTLVPNPRWNHMPIKVYIDLESGAKLPRFDGDDPQYVRQALGTWEEKTNSLIFFQEVYNPEEAEVMVSWFGDLSEIRGGKVVGEGGPTRAIETGGGFTLIEGGEIFLIPTEGKCVGVSRPVHEMGHVLGLGHISDKNDVMFQIEGRSCEQNITQITIDAVSELYKMPAAPDLFITNVSAVKRGGLLDVNFTIRNIGIVETSPTSVGFVGDGKQIESVSDPQFSFLPAIKPGSGLTKRITNAKVSSRLSELDLIADDQNKVSESSEDNNQARVTFPG